MTTPSPKKARSKPEKITGDSAASEGITTRAGKVYSPRKPASASHHVLRDVLLSAESDPFLTPQNEFCWEEVRSKLETQNEFLTARNKTLAEENVDLKRRLRESDDKVNKLSPLEERNQHLQNKVTILRESKTEQQNVIDRLESEKIDVSREVKSLRAEVNSLTEIVHKQENIINEQDGIIKLHEEENSESTESQLQDIKAKASKIKDLEDEMKVLTQELEQQVNTNEQLVKDREAEIDRLQEEPQAKDAEIARLKKEFETKYTQILTRFQAQIGPLREELQEKHEQIEHLQTALEEKQANATPDVSKPGRRLASLLNGEYLDGDSTSTSPIGGNNGVTTPGADEIMDDVVSASMTSHSEPNNDAAATFDSAEPPNVPMEIKTSTSGGKGCEDNPDVMEGIQGHSLTTGNGSQQSCSSFEEVVVLNDDRTIDFHGKVDNSAHPSSPPAAGEDGSDLLPNTVAPSSAGYISGELPAAPMALRCDFALTPDTGNSSVEDVTSTRLGQDLEVVTSIPPVPNTDASAMEDNGLTRPEAPNCEIAQHTVANVISKVSVEDTTTSLLLAGGNPTSIPDARDIAHPLPGPIKKLCSATDSAIKISPLGITLSPRKDGRDLALEPVALQHGNFSGDFSDGVKNHDDENDSILAPSLPSIEVSKEYGPTQHQSSQPSENHGEISVPSVPPTIDEPRGTACDVPMGQATKPSEITDGRSSNRNSSLPSLPLTSGEECRKDSNIHLNVSAELTTQPSHTSPPADGTSRSRSDVMMGGTDEPSMNLPLQPSSSSRKDRNCDVGNEHRSLVAPEPADKVPPNTLIPKPTSQSPEERSGDTSTTITSTREQITRQSYTKYGLEPILGKCFLGQPDLSQSLYDPNDVVLGHPQWEKRSVLNKDDIAKLPGQLKEITKPIPSKDCKDHKPLKRKLQGSFKLPIVNYSGTQDEILIAMAHREHAKATASGYEQTFAEIRHFSILLVIRYIHGQKKFNEIAKKHFHFTFSQFEQGMLEVCIGLHKLCFDLKDDPPWIGRRKALYTYFWSGPKNIRKNFFVRSKLPARYNALLALLRTPDFYNARKPPKITSEDSWADEIIGDLKVIVHPSISSCALGSSVPDPHSLSRTQLPALKHIALGCLGIDTVHEGIESEMEEATAQEGTGSVAAKSAEIDGVEALIGSSGHLNFDDQQPPTVSRDHVWAGETYQETADAAMEDVSSMQQIERNKDPKWEGELAINSSIMSTLPAHAAPSLRKATLSATAQLPSLESTQSAKPTNMDAAVSSALPKEAVPSSSNETAVVGFVHKTPAQLATAPADGVETTGNFIDLPTIPASEAAKKFVSWENTPALRRNEMMDPASIFPPTEVNLEDMFESFEHTGSSQTAWLKGKHRALYSPDPVSLPPSPSPGFRATSRKPLPSLASAVYQMGDDNPRASIPSLHKATPNVTAQLPSLGFAKLTKIPQKEKHDALSPNADAVVTPSRTLLPRSARTAPPKYSSPFGSLNKTAVTVARGSYEPKIHSNHQYPVLDLPTVDPPRSGDNKNDHSTTASAGTPMPYNTPPRSAKSPLEDTQESRQDVAPARPTNNGTPMAPPSPPRSAQTSCRDTKRRKPSNSAGSPEKQRQGVKRKRNSEMIEQPNQSPSKRQRWGPFGQYLIPLSSQLDIDIKSFASDLHNNDEYILIKAHRPWTLGVECYSKSILRLQSSEWFDDELINAVSALVEGPVNSRTVLISSFLYSHLKKGEFSKVDSWVEDLSEDQTRWAFGICENNHWVVIVIDFEATLILYYDPWEEENRDHARCIRTLEHVKNWVNYLCDLDTEQNQSWHTGMLRGPKQERDDTTSCGPLACWVLGVLRLGRDVIEGSIIYPSEVVNPLEVRTQLYHRLQAAPRTRRTADVDGETGADSDFEEISPEEASKGKGKMPSKSAKGPPVEGPSNSESKQQPPRDAPETEDSSLSDDETSATGSPWPDPNSPSFGKGDAAQKGKSIPPTVRKDDLVDADVNAQTTSSSAPSGVTNRETGGSAIDAFDDIPTAARVAVPTRQDIPNEALNGDPSHYLLPESPLAEQGIGTGETTGISNNAGDIYAVLDDSIESIQQSQKRKGCHLILHPKKRQRLGYDDDNVAASTPRNAPETAPSSLRRKDSSVPKHTTVSTKKSLRRVNKNEATPAKIVEPRISTSEQVIVDGLIKHSTATESLWEQQGLNSGTQFEIDGATSEHPIVSHVDAANVIATLSGSVSSQIDDWKSVEAKSIEKSRFGESERSTDAEMRKELGRKCAARGDRWPDLNFNWSDFVHSSPSSPKQQHKPYIDWPDFVPLQPSSPNQLDKLDECARGDHWPDLQLDPQFDRPTQTDIDFIWPDFVYPPKQPDKPDECAARGDRWPDLLNPLPQFDQPTQSDFDFDWPDSVQSPKPEAFLPQDDVV